jgi:hypothetical protein
MARLQHWRVLEAQDNMEQARDRAAGNMQSRQQRAKARHDAKHHEVSFALGSRVLLRTPPRPKDVAKGKKKMTPAWGKDVWQVTEQLGPNNYRVRCGRRRKVCNVRNMRAFKPSWDEAHAWTGGRWAHPAGRGRPTTKEGEAEAEDESEDENDTDELRADAPARGVKRQRIVRFVDESDDSGHINEATDASDVIDNVINGNDSEGEDERDITEEESSWIGRRFRDPDDSCIFEISDIAYYPHLRSMAVELAHIKRDRRGRYRRTGQEASATTEDVRGWLATHELPRSRSR